MARFINKDVKRWILTFAFLILGAVFMVSAVAAGEWITDAGMALAEAIGSTSVYIVAIVGALLITAVAGIWRSPPFLDRVLRLVRWA